MKKLVLIITIIASAVTADAKAKRPKFEVYDYPKGIELSDAYSVTVEGKDATVIPVNPGGKDVVCPPDSIAVRAKHGDEPHISLFGADKKVTVKVKFLKGAPMKVDVRPIAKGYEYELKGDVLTLKLDTYDRVSVEADGDIWEPLFIFVNPVETEMLAEAKSNPQTRVFEAGKIYKASRMNFKGDFKNLYGYPLPQLPYEYTLLYSLSNFLLRPSVSDRNIIHNTNYFVNEFFKKSSRISSVTSIPFIIRRFVCKSSTSSEVLSIFIFRVSSSTSDVIRTLSMSFVKSIFILGKSKVSVLANTSSMLSISFAIEIIYKWLEEWGRFHK